MVMAERHLCVATTKAGKPCRIVAQPGSDFCFSHIGTPEQRTANAQKGQRAMVRKQRREKNPLHDHAEIARDKLPLIYNALRAEIREPGWPVQPDWPTQLLALFVLIELTGAYEEPATVYTKLREMIPEELRPKPMPTMSEILRNARRQWDEVRAQWSELTGILPEPYPPHMLEDGMTQEQAQEEGRAYLQTVYGNAEEIDGLDSHVSATVLETGDGILIKRTPLNGIAA
jgi:hypothetical protein